MKETRADGQPGTTEICVFCAKDDAHLKGFANLFVKLIRRYKYLERSLEDSFGKVLMFLRGIEPEQRQKLATVSALLFCHIDSANDPHQASPGSHRQGWTCIFFPHGLPQEMGRRERRYHYLEYASALSVGAASRRIHADREEKRGKSNCRPQRKRPAGSGRFP